MYDTQRSTEQILSMLARFPARLDNLTGDLTPAQLIQAPHAGQWSARDTLAHLRACADMWGRYIRLILNQERPTFKAVNPTTWIKQTNYLEQEFKPSLEAFTAQRGGLLEVLEPLAPEDWSRAALVTGAGKPRERTAYSYALWLANHEQTHYRQFEKIVRAVQTAQP